MARGMSKKQGAERVAVASLVQDWDLYPRTSVDPIHVADLLQVLKSGGFLPPVVADRATRKVVDGWHRLAAIRRYVGNDVKAETDVLWRDYQDDAEVFADAIRLNAGHGRKLSPFDRARCIMKAEELGLDPVTIASVLAITIQLLAQASGHKQVP